MVYSLLWVMQDLYHQPYPQAETFPKEALVSDFGPSAWKG